jgi:uncharacterized protein YciI
MKILSNAFLLMLFTAAVITSCTMLREVDTNALKIGMTKAEAQAALRRKPDKIVAAKNFEDVKSIVEVVQYSQNGSYGYWLYFVNDKLEKFEPVTANHPPYLDDLVPIK